MAHLENIISRLMRNSFHAFSAGMNHSVSSFRLAENYCLTFSHFRFLSCEMYPYRKKKIRYDSISMWLLEIEVVVFKSIKTIENSLYKEKPSSGFVASLLFYSPSYCPSFKNMETDST